MLTIFAIPKRFAGHFSVIQKNAINSWINLKPRPEIILFGDEEGTSLICSELGLTHVPDVKRNEYGTPLISDIFGLAQEVSRSDIMCYSNCDIIFTDDLVTSLNTVKNWSGKYLITGRRLDLKIDSLLDFEKEEELIKLSRHAQHQGEFKPPNWIDYCIFSKGTIRNMLPFGVGRPGWDNWLLWYSSNKLELKLIDATGSITAIHQNHDYSHHEGGFSGVWESEEASRSYEMVGGPRNFYHISNSPYVLKNRRVDRNFTYEHLSRLYFMNCELRIRSMWFYLLEITRPIRHKIGTKKNKI